MNLRHDYFCMFSVPRIFHRCEQQREGDREWTREISPVEIMGIVKDLYSFPEEQKISSGALDFDVLFFVRRVHAIVSIHFTFTILIHNTRFWPPRSWLWLFTYTYGRKHNTVRKFEHTHSCACAAYPIRNTHTRLQDKKKDDLFPYLFI